MQLSRRSFALAGAAALGGMGLGADAWADTPARVRAVLLQETGAGVRIVIAVDRSVAARTFFLSSPDRFVIDLENAQLALPQGASGQGAGAGVVRQYRYAPREGGIARLVLDLDGPANLLRQDVGGRAQPGLSFDLAPHYAQAPNYSETIVAPPRRRDMRRRTIVIDAGHGGRDPGAVGVSGVREKDVVLDAALQLRDALESRGQYRVALTRDADNYVELENRVRFARAQNADLFISVHADSNANREARGASVYTLSERGANRAQGLMAAQNWDIDLGAAPRQGVVGDILVDLAQRETTNRSAEFAQALIPRLGQVSPLLTNTHRNAGFFVLLAPDVPAVLVETGFLSNAADERRLASSRERQALAEAMAASVDAFFAGPQIYARA